ncbi:VanZ family protein [Maribacter sp. 2307ULW6-5]
MSRLPHADKLVHFVFYGVMAVLIYLAIGERKGKKGLVTSFLWVAFLCAVVYGMVIEVLQHNLTTDRHGDIFDALANTLGAAVGALVIKMAYWAAPGLKSKN